MSEGRRITIRKSTPEERREKSPPIVAGGPRCSIPKWVVVYVGFDGTYELVGPKVQGDPEKYGIHALVPHESRSLEIPEPVPTDYEALRDWLAAHDVEGIVWHHPDGRMAKIKGKDFGIKRHG